MNEEIFPRIPELDELPGIPFLELRQAWGRSLRTFGT